MRFLPKSLIDDSRNLLESFRAAPRMSAMVCRPITQIWLVEARDSLQNYVGGSDINAVLRHNSPLSQREREHIANLDSIIVPLSQNTFMRVLHDDHPENKKFDTMKVGDHHFDPAYVSTTKNETGLKRLIDDMSEWGGEPKHIIHYHMKNPRGIDVNAHLDDNHYFTNQQEVVLPRNVTFIKTREQIINGVKHHYLKET